MIHGVLPTGSRLGRMGVIDSRVCSLEAVVVRRVEGPATMTGTFPVLTVGVL